MIDIKLIREHKDLVKANINKKFQDSKLPLVDEVYDLDLKFREAKQKGDNLRALKNEKSALIGNLILSFLFTCTSISLLHLVNLINKFLSTYDCFVTHSGLI